MCLLHATCSSNNKESDSEALVPGGKTSERNVEEVDLAYYTLNSMNIILFHMRCEDISFACCCYVLV
jgi:hypothetical protein